MPRELDVRVFWGSVELDFREASLGPGITTLDVRVTMASLELILPPQLAIDVDVSSFAGSVEERHRVPREPDPQRPLLRVVGAVVSATSRSRRACPARAVATPAAANAASVANAATRCAAGRARAAARPLIT